MSQLNSFAARAFEYREKIPPASKDPQSVIFSYCICKLKVKTPNAQQLPAILMHTVTHWCGHFVKCKIDVPVKNFARTSFLCLSNCIHTLGGSEMTAEDGVSETPFMPSTSRAAVRM